MSKNNSSAYTLDEVDKLIINQLQKGFPLSSRPYADAAIELGIKENELISRIKRLLDHNYLSRFGPMYDAAEFGGGLTLAAMIVPSEKFESVSEYLNSLKQVAHNYEREHHLNMWFVLATENQSDIDDTLEKIQTDTGCCVYNMPKLQSFFVNLYLPIE